MLRTLAVSLLWGTFIYAAPITVTSYDTRNGNGQASGGSFNYWDLAYTGSGSTNTDGALLSGGTGDLTNGVIANQNWNLVENNAGTGPYVGWRRAIAITANPLVTFRFGSSVTVNTITVYVDDANGFGGVQVPLSLDIGVSGGALTNYVLTDPAGGAPTSYTFTGLGLNASAIDIRFNHRDDWVFVSEVTFDGSAVPELRTYGLAGLGLLVIAVSRRYATKR